MRHMLAEPTCLQCLPSNTQKYTQCANKWSCWAEAPIKIARMTLTIKLDRNWNSFQLANSAPPLSVTDSAIAPSARMLEWNKGGAHWGILLNCSIFLLLIASAGKAQSNQWIYIEYDWKHWQAQSNHCFHSSKNSRATSSNALPISHCAIPLMSIMKSSVWLFCFANVCRFIILHRLVAMTMSLQPWIHHTIFFRIKKAGIKKLSIFCNARLFI